MGPLTHLKIVELHLLLYHCHMLVLPLLAKLFFLLDALVSLLLFVRFVLVLQQVFLPDAMLLILTSLPELLSIWNVLRIVLGPLSYMLLSEQRVV